MRRDPGSAWPRAPPLRRDQAHYKPFFAALRDTAEHFIGRAWTPETAASAWQAALDYISATMRAAAEEDAETSPPWWIAEIVSHELRSPGVAVIRLRPSEPLPYQAGQYVPVQVTQVAASLAAVLDRQRPAARRPDRAARASRAWRPGQQHAGSPLGHRRLRAARRGRRRDDAGRVRPRPAVRGGRHRAGADQGDHRASASRRPRPAPRKITLFVGARQHFDLYDLEDLQLLESACPALRVIPVLSDEPGYSGLAGMLPDVVGRSRPVREHRGLHLRAARHGRHDRRAARREHPAGPDPPRSPTLRSLAYRASRVRWRPGLADQVRAEERRRSAATRRPRLPAGRTSC